MGIGGLKRAGVPNVRSERAVTLETKAQDTNINNKRPSTPPAGTPQKATLRNYFKMMLSLNYQIQRKDYFNANCYMNRWKNITSLRL